ncbi:hypothetical protein [Cyclobacterium qasimii]|uniref:Uncharacterized protein n=1 Tax=Cyclobacterium qasimii M12-11B TaxID=641524 RepID=S7WY54_9BACT|nr:hypothetical protein [Cyclobacterium qasimii]EPR68883.1 hypothetical protein ADICYQ_2269 [Cyclobacterium qasimii M12-11B]
MKPNLIIDKILPALKEKDYPLFDLDSILNISEVSQEDFFSVYTDLDDFIIKAFYQLCAEADGLFEKNGQNLRHPYTAYSAIWMSY